MTTEDLDALKKRLEEQENPTPLAEMKLGSNPLPDRNDIAIKNLAAAWQNWNKLPPSDQEWLTKWNIPAEGAELHLGNLSVYFVSVADFNHLHRLANPEHWAGSALNNNP